jgi:hypothetical protein
MLYTALGPKIVTKSAETSQLSNGHNLECNSTVNGASALHMECCNALLEVA